MGRYVRTKDGIYELQHDNENEDTLVKEVVIIKDGELTRLNKSKIIKQADTIDELLDFECWECEKSKKNIVIPKDDTYTALSPYLLEDGVRVYGGVHIKGKGIIYFAKMNPKGKFRLL